MFSLVKYKLTLRTKYACILSNAFQGQFFLKELLRQMPKRSKHRDINNVIAHSNTLVTFPRRAITPLNPIHRSCFHLFLGAMSAEIRSCQGLVWIIYKQCEVCEQGNRSCGYHFGQFTTQ